MVYIAYAILLLWKTPVPLHWEFFLVSGLFLAVEIAHNDWARIRLNNSGENNKQEWEKPEWCFGPKDLFKKPA